jgi:hypothetical protein
MHQLERNNRVHLLQLDLDPDQTQTQHNTPGTHHGVIISNNLPLIMTWRSCPHSSAYSSLTSVSIAFSFFRG